MFKLDFSHFVCGKFRTQALENGFPQTLGMGLMLANCWIQLDHAIIPLSGGILVKSQSPHKKIRPADRSNLASVVVRRGAMVWVIGSMRVCRLDPNSIGRAIRRDDAKEARFCGRIRVRSPRRTPSSSTVRQVLRTSCLRRVATVDAVADLRGADASRPLRLRLTFAEVQRASLGTARRATPCARSLVGGPSGIAWPESPHRLTTALMPSRTARISSSRGTRSPAK